MISSGKNPGVMHVTSWLSRQGGGIPPVIWALARETKRQGIEATVVGLKDDWVGEDCRNNHVIFAAAEILGPKAFGFSPAMKKQLRAWWSPPTGIIHSHGLWMYPGLAARQCAQEMKFPLIISPHGMLEPWALKNSGWKKQLAGHLFEKRNLQKADCLHALCRAEADNFRRYGFKNPIAIIPNGVDIDDTSAVQAGKVGEMFPELAGKRRILFLSRLHPKKGLSNLLQAWKQIAQDCNDWQLLIAGSGDATYESDLKLFAADLISKKRVVFLGPVYGEAKKQILSAADIFVLPSFSEGFSMAILEAAAAGLPVLLTRECNFPELVKANAAIEVLPDTAAIEAGIRRLIQLPEEQRKAMGHRGRELIENFYTWPLVSEKMCQVYQWLAGNAKMPETVEII